MKLLILNVNKKTTLLSCYLHMEATTRFELVNGDFADLCLTAWRRRHIELLVSGAQRRNRTTDTGIFSPLLYRLSYLGKNNGGSDEGRTRDLMRDRHAL